jgi:hypothetical protein
MKNEIKLFEQQKVRTYWDENDGIEPLINDHRSSMKATNGKLRIADVADKKQLLRLIQPIPSSKAEPII